MKVPNNSFASSFVLKSEKKPATETYQLLQQAFGEDAIGRTQVFDWFRRFKEGGTSSECDPGSGWQLISSNVEMIAKVSTIVRNNRRLTVREIADDCGISVGSCDAVLTDDLHMKRVCAKFVLRLLTDDQREQRQTAVRDFYVRSCEDAQFLKYVYIVTVMSPGSTGTTRTQTAIVTAEGFHVSETIEGAPGAKQNKGHVTGVL